MENDTGQVGAVLTFHPSMTKGEVEKDLKEFFRIMRAKGREVQSCTVAEFNPSWGGPVWYVP